MQFKTTKKFVTMKHNDGATVPEIRFAAFRKLGLKLEIPNSVFEIQLCAAVIFQLSLL